MKLKFLGHDERYIVEQSLMTLFPLEKPTYDAVQPEDEAWCRLAAGETAADCQVTAELHYHGYTAAGTFASPLTGTDFEKEGQRRYAVAACFYLAFLDLYPKLPEALRAAEKLTLPPWGMLTGVRPVKLPTREMAAGATPEQARASLERDCYVSPERAELAVDCAQASLNAQRTLKEDEVSLYVGIPFCPTRCAYCSFVSADVGRTLKLLSPFLEVLLREVDATAEELRRSLTEGLALGGRTVLEEYIRGREIQVGILEDKALPSIEIIPKQGFYDYENKYQPGAALEVCPAEIPREWEEKIGQAALTVFRTVGLAVYSRADFIVTEDGTPYFLEINTLPGMTPTSLVPQEAAAVGIDYGQLCEVVIQKSLEARKKGE